MLLALVAAALPWQLLLEGAAGGRGSSRVDACKRWETSSSLQRPGETPWRGAGVAAWVFVEGPSGLALRAFAWSFSLPAARVERPRRLGAGVRSDASSVPPRALVRFAHPGVG